ncbi:MAG: SPASM domain-containing protein [Selenomonadaceae bacterium]|nr:SPASM domain-containing protein [Selenomonadaceae bacterium]
MKLSRYNILKKYDDATIFFNAATCALAVVDENFLRAVDAVKNNSFDEKNFDAQLIADMKSSGCLVDDDVDELERLEFYRNLAKYDMTNFGLTIAPTLDCNFRCKYCYETHPKGKMNSETQAALIKFVESRLERAKKFSVTWYGGEPLLAKEIVYSLSEKFLNLCEKFSVEYNAFIVTNASLFENSDVELFKKYKIRGAQITIDGPKEIHDSRRPSVSKESTFDKLIDSVNLLLNNDLAVVVRINIDKENIARVGELLDVLAKKINRCADLKIGFGQVTAYTDVCKSIESDCYNNAQFADIMLPLYEKVLAQGFTVNKMATYPEPRVNFCCADYANSFVLDNRGELYRCWNHVGNLKYSSGNVNDFGEEFGKNYLSWIQWNPIKHPKCRECNCLPICMGGCPDAMRTSNDKQPVCGRVKYNLEKVLEHYYEQLKGEIIE